MSEKQAAAVIIIDLLLKKRKKEIKAKKKFWVRPWLKRRQSLGAKNSCEWLQKILKKYLS